MMRHMIDYEHVIFFFFDKYYYSCRSSKERRQPKKDGTAIVALEKRRKKKETPWYATCTRCRMTRHPPSLHGHTWMASFYKPSMRLTPSRTLFS